MINIQEYQIKEKEKEIVNNILKNGDLVNTFDVITKLNSFFEEKTPGLPYYENLKLKPHSKSDKDTYNKSFKEFENDLNIAFSIYNNQEKAILEAKNTFDCEVLELYKEFDELNSEIELANEFSNKGIVYNPYIINFNTLENINDKNLYEHNIPRTTCEIDFDKSILRNELISTPNDKLDLSKSKIIVTTKSKMLNIDKDIKNIISENSTDVVNVETKSQLDSPQEISIEIIFDKYYYLSKIDMNCFNILNSEVTLFLSEYDDNYIQKETIKGDKSLSWVFNRKKLSRLKIIIKKNIADYKSKNYFSSIFSIINISAYNEKYCKNGVYTSNVIRFNESITDVMIIPSHDMPPKTDIGYYIGYEDKKNDIQWNQIKPNELFDLNLLYKDEMILNYTTSEDFGRWDFDRTTGKRLFFIHKIPKNTNLNSIYLRAGHSQWLIERLDVSDKYENGYPEDLKVNLSDYSSSRVTAISALDMSMTEIRCEKTWNYFIMSSYAICDEDTIIEDRFFSYDFTYIEDKKIETLDVVVLVNGRKIFAKDNKYSFRFKKGENQIKVIILFGNQDITDIENLKTIKHNFNLLDTNIKIFAGPAMKRMNYNSLYKYISEKDLKYYAIKTENNEDYIVTKFDPNFVLNPFDPYSIKTINEEDKQYEIPNIYINNSEYMRMYIKFKHMLQSTIEEIRNTSGDRSIRCRLMARLSSSDDSVSPTIQKVKVVGI